MEMNKSEFKSLSSQADGNVALVKMFGQKLYHESEREILTGTVSSTD